MYHFDIGQVQHPGDPFHQIDPPTRPIEQGESGVGHHDAERDPGEADPRADIEDEMGGISKAAGKDEGVADMSIVDSYRLVGADATCFDRFGEEPLPIPIQQSHLTGEELPTGPFRTTGPEEMGLFHVKQIYPGPADRGKGLSLRDRGRSDYSSSSRAVATGAVAVSTT